MQEPQHVIARPLSHLNPPHNAMADKDEQPEDLPLQTYSPVLPEGELPEEKKTQKRFIEDGAVDQTPPKKVATLNELASTGMIYSTKMSSLRS